MDVLRIYQVVPLEVVNKLFTACKSGDFDIANKEVDNIVAEGYPASQIINQVFYFPPLFLPHFKSCNCGYNHFYTTLFQLFDIVVEADNDITDTQKAKICKCLAETDKVRLPVLIFLTWVSFMQLVEDSSEINYQHLDSIILRVLIQVRILDFIIWL